MLSLRNPHNVIHPGTICGLNRYSIGQAIAGWRICGKGLTLKPATVEKTNCVVFWGNSPTDSIPRASDWIMQERRKRPIRTIAVDPRVTKIAETADIHLQLRPGTDVALALGWAHVIVIEGLYDREFVENWTIGLDKLAERVREYPPQKVAAITRLTADQIIDSARMYATSKPAWIVGGVATDQIGLNSARAEQSCAICQALTGNIDILGGSSMLGVGPGPEGKRFIRVCQLELRDMPAYEQRRKQLGSDRFKR